jgi:hypothetical protein
MPEITVLYTSIDRCRTRRKFKTLKGAQKFAHHLIGAHPEIGFHYAVSGDGIGKVQVTGATLAELFPDFEPLWDKMSDEDREDFYS